jgi:MFS family permease
VGHAAIETQREERRRWMALALIVTAQFMVILDVTIVNVALPSIQRDLGFAQENLQWVITAYTIMFGGTLLLGGRLADLLGRRRLLLVGLALFSFSSLLCGLAWSESSLIAFRAAQGLGAALLVPAALALLVTTFTSFASLPSRRALPLPLWRSPPLSPPTWPRPSSAGSAFARADEWGPRSLSAHRTPGSPPA